MGWRINIGGLGGDGCGLRKKFKLQFISSAGVHRS